MRLLQFSLFFQRVSALVYEQVAFDSSNVCWWSLVPQDLTCPVLKHQNLDEVLANLTGLYRWEGGDECEGDYCIYFNKGFAGGRGIAVVTKADHISKVKDVGDLLQSFEVSFSSSSKLPYKVDEAEGKESSVIASQALSRGAPIMGHTPVLLAHQAFKEGVAPGKQHRLLEAAVQSLPDETRNLLGNRITRSPGDHSALDTLTTKAFQVNLGGDNGHYQGVFPEAAKLNHDCRPNAVFYIEPTTLMHIITAVRPISPGEKLTLSHWDPLSPRAERQEHADLVQGSECKCSQCSLPPDEAAESDSRLREIKWIETQLEDFETPDVHIGLVTYLVQQYKLEKLESKLSRPYTLAALNFNALGYEKRAIKYAAAAIDALKFELGAGAPDVKVMEELIRDPQGQSSYKERVGKRQR